MQADRQVDSERVRDVDASAGMQWLKQFSLTFWIRYLAFWTLPSVWRVCIIWFLRAVDSAGEGEVVLDWEEEEEEEDDEELKGLGSDGKDIFVRFVLGGIVDVL